MKIVSICSASINLLINQNAVQMKKKENKNEEKVSLCFVFAFSSDVNLTDIPILLIDF